LLDAPMKPLKPYDDERLASLLRLLRPAPKAWVQKAKGIPLTAGAPLTDEDLAELARKLEVDASFRELFDLDPVRAAEAAGMRRLAAQLRREILELVALAERIAQDDAYRAELAEDPLTALAAAGVPAETAEPLFRALAVPDDWLAKVPDVVAHRHRRMPLRARLVIILLSSSAVGAGLRSAATA
jgi:putative modified peptide